MAKPNSMYRSKKEQTIQANGNRSIVKTLSAKDVVHAFVLKFDMVSLINKYIYANGL